MNDGNVRIGWKTGIETWVTGALLYAFLERFFLSNPESYLEASVYFLAYAFAGLLGGIISVVLYSMISAIFKPLANDRFHSCMFIVVFSNVVSNFNITKTALYDYLSAGYKDNLVVLIIWLGAAITIYITSGWFHKNMRWLYLFLAKFSTVLLLVLIQAESWYFDLLAYDLRTGWYLAVSGVTAAVYSLLIYSIVKVITAKSFRWQTKIPWKAYPVLLTIALMVTHFSVAKAFSEAISESARQSKTLAEKLSVKPNIILLIMDTVRGSHLKSYGYCRNTMPNLEAISSVTVYKNAWSTASWTSPAHASIFTGLLPSRSGFNSPQSAHLDERHETLAEILYESGYATAGFVANYGLYRGNGFEQGFQDYIDVVPRGIHQRLLRSMICRIAPVEWVGPARFHTLFCRANSVNMAVTRWLDKNQNHPFFIFANYMDAHWPYMPPQPFDKLFPEYDYDVAVENSKIGPLELGEGRVHLGPKLLEFLKNQYDGELAYLDSQLDQLIKEIKSRGLFDNSLIIITSDHGESLGDHQYLLHGAYLYEGLTRIPLFVKYPGANKSAIEEIPVQLHDLFPTILETAGIQVPNLNQGQNLGHVSHEIVMEHYGPKPLSVGSRSAMRRAIIADGLKYIFEEDGKHELYDINIDQEEINNLVIELSEEASTLSERLENMSSQFQPVFSDRKVNNPSAETLKRLRNLGYVK